MGNFLLFPALAFAGFLIGYANGSVDGWRGAHKTVAEECRRLGGFFVGASTFRCAEADKDHDRQHP